MPEYACEPAYGRYDEPLSPAGKYIENTFVCWPEYKYDYTYPTNYGGPQWLSAVAYKCCGFLAETSTSETAAEERPLSFYLAVVALVYCVVLTIVFAVWASRNPRNTAVMRRAPTRPLPPPPPQVVIQNQV